MPPDGQVKSPGSGSHCSMCQGGYLVGLAKDDPRLGGGKVFGLSHLLMLLQTPINEVTWVLSCDRRKHPMIPNSPHSRGSVEDNELISFVISFVLFESSLFGSCYIIMLSYGQTFYY